MDEKYDPIEPTREFSERLVRTIERALRQDEEKRIALTIAMWRDDEIEKLRDRSRG